MVLTSQDLNKNTTVTAFGIAAFNMIWQFTDYCNYLLNMGMLLSINNYPITLKLLWVDLKDVILIIIDEVSMISNVSNLISMYIHLQLCEIFDWLLVIVLVMVDLVKSIFYLEICFNYLPYMILPLYIYQMKKFVNIWVLLALLSYGLLYLTMTNWWSMHQQGDGSYRELLSRIRVEFLKKKNIL